MTQIIPLDIPSTPSGFPPLLNGVEQGNLALKFKTPLRRRSDGYVLVIDDEDKILSIVVKFFELYGIQVKGFTNPVQAINWYEDNWNNVNLVFLDMKNPHMDGECCFALLQSINPEVRIALMSGGVDMKIVNKLLGEGALRFFAKPFDFPSLLSWTMRRLGKPLMIRRKTPYETA